MSAAVTKAPENPVWPSWRLQSRASSALHARPPSTASAVWRCEKRWWRSLFSLCCQVGLSETPQAEPALVVGLIWFIDYDPTRWKTSESRFQGRPDDFNAASYCYSLVWRFSKINPNFFFFHNVFSHILYKTYECLHKELRNKGTLWFIGIYPPFNHKYDPHDRCLPTEFLDKL